jgi:hypothetical protein
MKAKVGDFVTATVNLRGPHPTRQGIYIGGNGLLGETGTIYQVVKIHTIVTDLFGSTLEFVNEWRKANGIK